MSGAAVPIGLLLVSAVLHTTWNLMLKQAGEKYMATFWAMFIGSILFLPALLFFGLPSQKTWLIMVISAFVEGTYFVVLSYAYDDADFSLVYPVARGTAPALIVLWSVVFLREQLTVMGVVGVALIIAALMLMSLSGAMHVNGKLHWRGILPALFLALCISIYTVLDGHAVRLNLAGDSTAEHLRASLSYAPLIYFISSLYMAPFVLRRHPWNELRSEFARYGWKLTGIGLLILAAYTLALVAYNLWNVSYAGSIREVGVVMGAIAGWLFLKEKMGAMRVLGAVVIFAGIVVIAIWG